MLKHAIKNDFTMEITVDPYITKKNMSHVIGITWDIQIVLCMHFERHIY